MHVGVGFDHKGHQLRSPLLAKMKAVVSLGMPGAHGALENDTLAGRKKHLRATAGVVSPPGVLDALEDQTDIADAFAHLGDAPRPTTRFVEAGCREIPGNGGRILQRSPLPSSSSSVASV